MILVVVQTPHLFLSIVRAMESTVQELSFLLTSKLHSLHLRELFSLAFLAYFSYWALVYIYRITFHPLAKFPGPKLAAISYWYEAWYDVFPHSGRYLWKIQELHEQYGKRTRVSVNTVSLI